MPYVTVGKENSASIDIYYDDMRVIPKVYSPCRAISN
jgi:hypothetical protein